MRAAFRDEKKTMVIFVTMKEAREGMTGEVLLGRKEIINQTGTMEFYCFSPIHFYQCLGFYPPRVIVCWSGSQIPSCGRLLMAAYLFCICATHRSFCMINCLHLSTRRRRPCHLVVVGWEAQMGFIRSLLPQNNGNLPLPFFGGNYPIVLLYSIY